MLATYNGKEYCCKNLSRNGILLISKIQTDNTFELSYNVYTKVVNRNECDNIKTICIYAVYKDQKIEIANIDTNTNKLLLYTSSTHIYSEEFLKEILEGKIGRDIYTWCNIEKFTNFYLYTEDFLTHDNKENSFISVEKAIEYISLLNFE